MNTNGARGVGIVLAALVAILPRISRGEMTELKGHILGIVREAKVLPLRRKSAKTLVTITVVMNRTDPPAYRQFVDERQRPGATSGKRPLTPEAMLARFGPTTDAYTRVSRYLTGAGLKVASEAPNRLTLTLRGTRSQVERAFQVRLRDYSLHGREFFANENEPRLPRALSKHVAAVWGLTNSQHLKHFVLPAPFPTAISNAYGTGGIVPDVAISPPLDGSNQIIGLPQYYTYQKQDLSDWVALTANPPSPSAISPTVLGRIHQSTFMGTPTYAGAEPMVDIETAVGVAPGASSYEVYTTGDNTPYVDLINHAVTSLQGTEARLISFSYGLCESSFSAAQLDSFEAVASNAVAVGVSIFASSGDSGNLCATDCMSADCYRTGVTFPASAPSVVAVGGTTLEVDGAGHYQSEHWWNDGNNSFDVLQAGGYGVSAHFSRPAYQAGFTSSAMRSVPDVSAEAMPGITVCSSGCTTIEGGTSLATPLWAATWALVAEASGAPRFVATHDLLYSLSNVGFRKPQSMQPPNNDFAPSASALRSLRGSCRRADRASNRAATARAARGGRRANRLPWRRPARPAS